MKSLKMVERTLRGMGGVYPEQPGRASPGLRHLGRGRAVARQLGQGRERAMPHRRGDGRRATGDGRRATGDGRDTGEPGGRRQGDVLLRRRDEREARAVKRVS